jgi:RimJ/RimL family protein N-acetyltransferase
MNIKEFDFVDDREKILRTLDSLIEEDSEKGDFRGRWSDKEFYINEYFQKPEYKVFLALDEGLCTGYIIGRMEDKQCDIEMHYILPGYRKKGIAKRLKTKITDYMKDNGIEKIKSWVSSDNTASIKLNESLGWKIIEEYKYCLFAKDLK